MAEEEVRWRFHGYKSPAGNALVQEWLDGIPETARAEFEDVLIYLRVLPVQRWGRPPFDYLDVGLSEIRVKDNIENKQYRLYGFFWPGRFRYTFLHGVQKKVKNDQEGKGLAARRKKQVETREAGIHEFRFTQKPDSAD